jgi:DNA-binding transcriptional regulator GbsR (MarR family)
MKNTDPPRRSRHRPRRRRLAQATPRITPDLHRFIEHMGGYFESSGVPRIGGLILALLILAHEPLSAEQIASILKISRASISTNFRILAAVGLAERFTSHADRIAYYVFPDTAWEQMMAMTIRRVVRFKQIVAEGLRALPQQDAAHDRLIIANEYSDLQIKAIQKVMDEWRTQQRPAPRIASSSHAR